MGDERTLTVGEVNAYIRNMFARDYVMRRIAVKGEVSNCRYHSSGHIFFSLKDDNGVLGAVMFASNRKAGLKFALKDGDDVIVIGSVGVYERNGRYQLYAAEVCPDGVGILHQRFELLKEKLEEMGMFAKEYKKPIPKYASRIGVVTAPTGAAVRDIQNVILRRNPYAQIILYPALVQGEGAAASISRGIRMLDSMDIDLMIVGRGGGSTEDLWAFNEEEVARAIFECTHPVISAVGHETDITISDLVADLKAPTPSAAAELAAYEHLRLIREIDEYARCIGSILLSKIENLRRDGDEYRLKIEKMCPTNLLEQRRLQAADCADRLYKLFSDALGEKRDDAHTARERMQRGIETAVCEKRQKMGIYAAVLDAHSPLKRLSGGYAFLTREGDLPIGSVSALSGGDKVRARLKDGTVTARVEDVALL